jgi:sulfite exporter TauE/SafE
MIELPLIFVAGLLGTAHCLGMCGPFALLIGANSRSWIGAVARQFAYTAGRVFTYGVLGAAAGYCGTRLAAVVPTFVNIPAALAIAAGLLLAWQGLKAAGWWPTGFGSRWRTKAAPNGIETARHRLPTPLAHSAAPCLASGFIGQFLRQRNGTGVFLAGIFTGLLPCGLLYGMLALATSTHSIPLGMATMMVFGLGTAPAMILAGLSGRIIGLATRRRLFAAAAWCLVLTGLISVARGVSYLSIDHQPPAGCPLCQK